MTPYRAEGEREVEVAGLGRGVTRASDDVVSFKYIVLHEGDGVSDL